MMKKNYFMYILLLILHPTFLSAQTAQEIFLQANKLYDEKKFDDAAMCYQSLEPKDCAILYNMGNCYYRLNNHAQAIACWHQAQKKAPDFLLSHIATNIAVSKDVVGVSDHNDWSILLSRLVNGIAILWLQLLFLFLLFTFFFFIKDHNHGKKYRMFFGTLLLVSLACSNIILVIKYQSLKQRKGIVMKSNVSLFAGPNESYHVLASLKPASCIQVIEERVSWCKIRYNSVTGWVVKDSLTVV